MGSNCPDGAYTKHYQDRYNLHAALSSGGKAKSHGSIYSDISSEIGSNKTTSLEPIGREEKISYYKVTRGGSYMSPPEHDEVEVCVDCDDFDSSIEDWEQTVSEQNPGFVPDKDTRAALVYLSDMYMDGMVEEGDGSEGSMGQEEISEFFPTKDDYSPDGTLSESARLRSDRLIEEHISWAENITSEEESAIRGIVKIREAGANVSHSAGEMMYDAAGDFYDLYNSLTSDIY